MLVVAKFGGSSVASSACFKQIKNIVESDECRKIVVTSAIGKANPDDNKVTDLLYLMYAHVKYKVNYDNILSIVKSKYFAIKEELGLKLDLNKEFDNIVANLKLGEDYLVSRGEYLTALLLAEYLGYEFIDAKDLIVFDYNGKVNLEKTYKIIASKIDGQKKVLVPGFYGAYPNGDIKLFSRGGSDITGSILARGVNASKYENFTDVPGFYVASPKIVNNPKLIKEITYNELRELSYMGASVIHEEAVFPIQDVNIPLQILATHSPKLGGTMISSKCSDKENVITGIAGKKGFAAINIVKSKASDKLNIISYALNVLKEHNVPVESIPTSIDSFSIVVEEEKVSNNLYDIIAMLKENPEIEDIKIDNEIALVAVVGRNMVYKPGISAKIFSILGKNDINVKLISQNTSEINIIVGIKNSDLNKAINAIYEGLIK